MVDVINLIIDYGFWIAVIFVVLGILLFAAFQIRNRMIYTYLHETTRLRHGQKVKTITNKAGFIKKRNGITYFRLMLGRMPWQHHDLVEHPNLAEVDGNNKVYYTQLGTDIFIQSSKRLIPQIEYSDYVRDSDGKLVPMRNEKGEIVCMRDSKGQLIYEEVMDENNQIKQIPIPVYIPVPKEYKFIEEIKPISNITKAYGAATIATASRAIEGEQNWKAAIPWIGGVVLLVMITILSYYFLFGGGAKV